MSDIPADVMERISEANIMELFPSELREKVRNVRMAYLAYYEDMKVAILHMPHLEQLMKHNIDYLHAVIVNSQSKRIFALDEDKKEQLMSMVDKIFDIGHVFTANDMEEFCKSNVNKFAKNLKRFEETGDPRIIKRIKKKKKRSKRGGGKVKTENIEESSITFSEDDRRLKLGYGHNFECMTRIAVGMEGIVAAVLDILETDFSESREKLFETASESFGELADPLVISEDSRKRMKAIVEMLQHVSPKEEYPFELNHCCRQHIEDKDKEEENEGVIIEDITQDVKNEKEIEEDNESVESETVEEKLAKDGHELFYDILTAPSSDSSCPCCCKGCYPLYHAKDELGEKEKQESIKDGHDTSHQKKSSTEKVKISKSEFTKIMTTPLEEEEEEYVKQKILEKNSEKVKISNTEEQNLKQNIFGVDVKPNDTVAENNSQNKNIVEGGPHRTEDENTDNPNNKEDSNLQDESTEKKLKLDVSKLTLDDVLEADIFGDDAIQEDVAQKFVEKKINDYFQEPKPENYNTCSHCICTCGSKSEEVEIPDVENDPEAFALTLITELKRISPGNRLVLFKMGEILARNQFKVLKQKVVEIGMHHVLEKLKEMKMGFHLYIVEIIMKVVMSTSQARKYCYRDEGFFPAMAKLLALVDDCVWRDKNHLRGDAVHILYVTLMGGQREAFEKVARSDVFESLINFLYEKPNNSQDIQAAEDTFLCLNLFTDEWDLFIDKFKAAPIKGHVKMWRRYALEYTSTMPNFIWVIETVKKRLDILSIASRVSKFTFRLPTSFQNKYLESEKDMTCANTKCLKINHIKIDNVKFKKCSKCHVAFYCSKECQLAHWKRHKQWCLKSEWQIMEEKSKEKSSKPIEHSDSNYVRPSEALEMLQEEVC